MSIGDIFPRATIMAQPFLLFSVAQPEIVTRLRNVRVILWTPSSCPPWRSASLNATQLTIATGRSIGEDYYKRFSGSCNSKLSFKVHPREAARSLHPVRRLRPPRRFLRYLRHRSEILLPWVRPVMQSPLDKLQ